MDKVVILSKDIFIFEGFNRSLLVDITNGDYHIISNNWKNLILKLNDSDKSNVCMNLTENEKDDFESLILFLNKNKYIVEVDREQSDLFKDIELEFCTPFIFDILFCEVDNKNFDVINTILNTSSSHCFGGFNLVLYDLSLENIYKLQQIIEKLPENKNINIYLDNKTKGYFSKQTDHQRIVFHDVKIKNSLELKEYFYNKFPIMNIGIKNIIESKNSNYFYNKTIFINKKGDIVSSLFDKSPKVFMKNSELSIDQIIKLKSNKEFTELWKIKNSEIMVCKDCEFHRVCIDCRTPFLENNKWKKEPCLYNPYTSKWKEK